MPKPASQILSRRNSLLAYRFLCQSTESTKALTVKDIPLGNIQSGGRDWNEAEGYSNARKLETNAVMEVPVSLEMSHKGV